MDGVEGTVEAPLGRPERPCGDGALKMGDETFRGDWWPAHRYH